jgi:hypothetical protein
VSANWLQSSASKRPDHGRGTIKEESVATKKTVEDMRLFDRRAVERNIKRGYITREQYEAHLKGLESAAEEAKPLETDQATFVVEREEARRLLATKERSRSVKEEEEEET